MREHWKSNKQGHFCCYYMVLHIEHSSWPCLHFLISLTDAVIQLYIKSSSCGSLSSKDKKLSLTERDEGMDGEMQVKSLENSKDQQGCFIRAISFFVCCETPGRGEKA